MECKNNRKNIALALHSFASSNGGNFPPTYTVDNNGKRLHSWRTLILAHLDRRDLYDRVDYSKPWDVPSNAEIVKSRVRFISPATVPASSMPARDLPESTATA